MPTIQCLSRDALKEYLSGWTDAERSDAIESHLTQCSDCEQTIHALESDPDTLIEFVRNSRNEAAADAPVADSAIAYALSRAKKISTAGDDPVSKWQPPVGDFGPYELLRPLGHGGMASVYLARHRQLGKQVAIKLLPSRPFRNDHYAARFQREIRTAGQLNHPAIVSATDAGEHAGTHYLVMEYIEGLDLSRVARLNGPLPIADACAIMRTVALGLSHAHIEGIVHRDIKPSNLMLSVAGDVKILDFGLAQVSLWDEVSAELTTVGQLMGTLDYMAPEQAERPEAVDYRADLYSIGATLFRLLCGRPPLAAAPDLSPLVKLRLLASHQPPRLDTLRADAPEKLVEFMTQLLARNPADRPASAAHVAEQLAQFTDSADLKSLIATAHSKSPHESAPASMLTLASSVAAQADSSGDGRRIIRWLVAASLLPLLILAGILITLETQKGQLVIESESANVEVKLLRDGEFYEKLKITPGVNSTRLYAGKYEVIVDSGSDAVSFDHPEIEITRGNTVIARVRNVRDPAKETYPVLSPESSESQGLLYGGRNLASWLDTFERERSPEELGNVFAAFDSFASDKVAAKEIQDAILRLLPELKSQKVNETTIDRVAFPILLKCQGNAQSFSELIVTELEKANPEWSRRIIFQACILAYDDSSGSDFEPIRMWIARNVFQSDRYLDVVDSVAAQFLKIQSDPNIDISDRQRIIDDLLACEKLGLEFWLSPLTIPSRSYTTNPFWTPQCAEAVQSKLVQALLSDKTDLEKITDIVLRLQIIHPPGSNQIGNPKSNKTEVRKAIELQVNRLCADRELLLNLTPLSREATDIASRGVSGFGKLRSFQLGLGINWNNGEKNKALLVEELLTLIAGMETESEYAPVLENIMKATREEAYGFANTVSNPYTQPSVIFQVELPQLTFETQAARPTRSQFLSYLIFDMAFGMLPEAEQMELEPEHIKQLKLLWLDSLVEKLDKDEDGRLSYAECQKEFTQPTQLPFEVDIAAADADNDQFISAKELFEYLEKPREFKNVVMDAAKPTEVAVPEPIYEGKTLSEWLEQFGRERSPAGTGAALEAINTLVSKSDAQRVEKLLIENLRTLGNRTIVYEGGKGGRDIDPEAFPILARCFTSQREYFGMLVKELECADEVWSERILKSAVDQSNWQPADIEPLVAWIEKNVLQSKKSPQLTRAAANLFLSLIASSTSTPDHVVLKNRLVDSLASATGLELDFWLSQRPQPQMEAFRAVGEAIRFRPYHPRLASAIESKAMSAIIKEGSTDVEVTSAAALLSAFNSGMYDRKDMTARTIADETRFIQALGKRLVTQTADAGHRLACETLSPRFNGLGEQSFKGAFPFVSTTPQARSNFKIYESMGPLSPGAGKRNVAVELLDCVANLNLESQLHSDLRAVVEATRVEAQLFAREMRAHIRSNTFPPIIALDRLDASPFPSPLNKFTSEDCLNYIIFAKAYRLLSDSARTEIVIDKAISELDRNGDGALNYDEVQSAISAPAEFDVNKDQVISREEFLQSSMAGELAALEAPPGLCDK